jgi:hypothetical protein
MNEADRPLSPTTPVRAVNDAAPPLPFVGAPLPQADNEVEDEGGERLLDGVRARVISVSTLSWPLRTALSLAALILLALGASLIFHDAPLPVLVGLPVDQRSTQVPLVALLLGVLALGLAWTLALAGAFRAHWNVRLLVLLLFTLTQGPTMLLALTDGGLLLVGGLLELGAVFALWTWGVTTIILDRPAVRSWLHRLTPPHRRQSRLLGNSERALTLVTVSLVPCALLVSVSAELITDLHSPGYNFTLAALTIRLSALFLLLLPALMLAGTDAAEWGELVVGRLAFLAHSRRRPWLLHVLVLAIVLLSLADVALDVGVRLRPTAPLISLVLLFCPLLTLGGGIPLALRLGNVRHWPKGALPFGAPLGIAACYFVGLIPSFFLAGTGGKLLALAATSYLALVIGLPLLWGYRSQPGPWATTGLLFTLFGLYTLATLLAAAVLDLYEATRFPGAPHTGPEVLSLYGAQALATLVTLGLLVSSALPLHMHMRLRLPWPIGGAQTDHRLLAALASLNAGLLTLVVLTRYFATRPEVGQRYALGPVVLLVAAFLWEFVSSGEAVTNRSSRAFPRTARVLLYAGYTLAVATAVIFFGSLTFAQSAQQAFAVDDTTWALLGAIVLGAPVLLTSFLLRIPRFILPPQPPRRQSAATRQ